MDKNQEVMDFESDVTIYNNEDDEKNENTEIVESPKNEIVMWDVWEFYTNFETNAERALKMLAAAQSNEEPNKKGGVDVGFRCDLIIFKNKQRYTAQENAIADIISGYISSYPDNDAYKIYIKDIAKSLGYKAENYAYEIVSKSLDSLKRKPLLIDVPGKAEKAAPLEIQWWSLFDYMSKKDLEKNGINDNAHIIIVPTTFYKALVISSTVAHGAHYSNLVANRITGNYTRTLFYILQSRKKYRENKYSKPGVFTMTIEEMREYIGFPESCNTADIKRRIIENLKRELDNCEESDIKFDYTPVKKGNKIIAFTFEIKYIIDIDENADIVDGNLIEEQTPLEYEFVKEYGYNTDEINKIYKCCVKNNKSIKDLTKILVMTEDKEDIKNKIAYVCALLEKGIIKKEQRTKENKFNNFPSRERDFDDLERILLNSTPTK